MNETQGYAVFFFPQALEALGAPSVRSLDDALALDAEARREAMRMAARRSAAA